MSNQVYIPPINFNENEYNNSSTVSINAIEPLEYNKLNSNLSIKAATENNYGVLTTGDQNIKGNKNFINGIISEDAIFINLNLTNGTITSEPTNNTDIVNKGYVDAIADEINNKTADMAKYDVSTNYLVSNKTGSNITNLNINSLNVSDNYINKEPNTVLVRTRGPAGTFDKYITIYKSILNGRISIIFDKNLDFNDYSNVTDVSLREMIFNISDMSNISQIYDYLPNEFELTGEVSTYGGTKNIATKTLKFKKSPSDLYKYDLYYDKSFPFNIFKLKESIKNIDTVISTSEIQKINSLTIDKGYLINTPTEDNNLVNKGYVDNVKSELNTSIENAKSEMNNNISTKISQISEITLNSGTLQNTKNNDYSLTNKIYVDNQVSKAKLELNNTINSTKSEINGSIDSSVNNAKSELNTSIENAKSELNNNITTAINNIEIKNVDLTTGTISTVPANDTDITNKIYTDNKTNEAKTYCDSNFVTYDSGTSKLIKSSQNIDNLILSSLTSQNSTLTYFNSTSSTINTLTINDRLDFNSNLFEIINLSGCQIQGEDNAMITLCTFTLLKIKLNLRVFINIKIDFSEPFLVGTNTGIFIKNLQLADLGKDSYGGYLHYFYTMDSSGQLFIKRTPFFITKNESGNYDIEITTQKSIQIWKLGEIKQVYVL